MSLIGGRQMTGLRAADQKQVARAATHAYVAVADAEIFVLTDQPGLVQRLAPGIEFPCRRDVRGRPWRPVADVLDSAFVDRQTEPFCGNKPASPAVLAAQIPRSVIRPVISRAGVTSKAKLLTGVSGLVVLTVHSWPLAMPRT